VSDVSVTLPPRPDALTCRLCGDEFIVKTGATATLAALIALDAHVVRDHDVWPSTMSLDARSARMIPP
jgi:dihydropteroate synthase